MLSNTIPNKSHLHTKGGGCPKEDCYHEHWLLESVLELVLAKYVICTALCSVLYICTGVDTYIARSSSG